MFKKYVVIGIFGIFLFCALLRSVAEPVLFLTGSDKKSGQNKFLYFNLYLNTTYYGCVHPTIFVYYCL